MIHQQSYIDLNSPVNSIIKANQETKNICCCLFQIYIICLFGFIFYFYFFWGGYICLLFFGGSGSVFVFIGFSLILVGLLSASKPTKDLEASFWNVDI